VRVAGQRHAPASLPQGKISVIHRREGRVDPRAGMDRTDFGIDTVSNKSRGSFPGIKRAGRKADHYFLFNTVIKNEWSDTSTPLYAFMAWTEKTIPLYLSGTHYRVPRLNDTKSAFKYFDKQYTASKKNLPCV